MSLRSSLCIALVFMGSLALGGCVASGTDSIITGSLSQAPQQSLYGPRPNEAHPMPATNVSGVNPKYFRQTVNFRRPEAPGTIVVDTNNRFLYLVQSNGRAMRYGIGVGKAGLAWGGTATVGRKAVWPSWTPTADMIEREPERNAKWAGGMPGGLNNPLGPRALYLFDNGRDTMFRIHGTTEPHTIGKAVSSGCIRMFNQDVIDLYDRVPVGTKVVVLHNSHPLDQFGDAMASAANSLGKGLSELTAKLPQR
jgi:lipoprotein-anchoring transpeptidase ErfK/SrfK